MNIEKTQQSECQPRSTIQVEDELGIQFCHRQSIAIERGAGSYVWDETGAKYLDFTSGWGVTCLGHSHPVITDAIVQQANKIIQNPNSGFTYSPARARLLSLLQPLLPDNLRKIYFANSGSEANDAAIKLARKITGKSKVVSSLGSFHGRTFNTLSISLGEENTAKFLPSLTENCFVPFGDIEAIAKAIDKTTAAVILEPIQGEGGVRIPHADYLFEVARLCKLNNALLIIDEIQTGFCRTGSFFEIQNSDRVVAADILTMGKGIAGGFPFAGFAVTDEVSKSLNIGDHGGTFCGNPLGCAVAYAVVDFLISHNIAESVKQMAHHLEAPLQSLKARYPHLIKKLRGRGLLWALELEDDTAVQALTSACLELGLLITPTRGGIVRLIPNLLIDLAQLNEGVAILDRALAKINT